MQDKIFKRVRESAKDIPGRWKSELAVWAIAFAIVGPVVTFLIGAWDRVSQDGWAAVMLASIFSTALLLLVFAMCLASWRLFRPLPDERNWVPTLVDADNVEPNTAKSSTKINDGSNEDQGFQLKVNKPLEDATEAELVVLVHAERYLVELRVVARLEKLEGYADDSVEWVSVHSGTVASRDLVPAGDEVKALVYKRPMEDDGPGVFLGRVIPSENGPGSDRFRITITASHDTGELSCTRFVRAFPANQRVTLMSDYEQLCLGQ